MGARFVNAARIRTENWRPTFTPLQVQPIQLISIWPRPSLGPYGPAVPVAAIAPGANLIVTQFALRRADRAGCGVPAGAGGTSRARRQLPHGLDRTRQNQLRAGGEREGQQDLPALALCRPGHPRRRPLHGRKRALDPLRLWPAAKASA